jgi:hypothetical protein
LGCKERRAEDEEDEEEKEKRGGIKAPLLAKANAVDKKTHLRMVLGPLQSSKRMVYPTC